MEAQRVHEYTVETGPNGLPIARLGKVHNLIDIKVDGDPKRYNYLDGRWVTDNGQPVDEGTVPQAAKDIAESMPFNPTLEFSADVMRDCEFCPFSGPNRDYAKHLADVHVRRPETTVDPAHTPPEPARLRPEELPPGSYVLDDEGFVVLNTDGTPRKRAGRPKKDAE